MPKVFERMKDLPVEEQVKTLSKILEHHATKLRKTVVYGAPIIFIDGYLATGNGTVLRHMLGLESTLVAGMIYIEACVGQVYGTMRLTNEAQNLTFDVRLRQGATLISKPSEFPAGTRIVFTVVADDPAQLVGVWGTLVLKPKLPKEAIETIVIDKLVQGANQMLTGGAT